MSPTYWTASQIIAAAREHGWETIPAEKSGGLFEPPKPWSVKKGITTIEIFERRDGGLLKVTIRRSWPGGSDVYVFGPRDKGKLATVLRFIEEGDWLQVYMTPEWLAWWKSLDHSAMCSHTGPQLGETMEEYDARPDYQKCRSMHCAVCEKPTGAQGHYKCPEDASAVRA